MLLIKKLFKVPHEKKNNALYLILKAPHFESILPSLTTIRS